MFANKDKNKRLSRKGVAMRTMKAGKAIANALSPTGGSPTPDVDSGDLYVDKGGSKYLVRGKPNPDSAPSSPPNSSDTNISQTIRGVGLKKKDNKRNKNRNSRNYYS
jgi:hypothetical protein|tara:strand:- start:911 stop:1231 length:321 start_codon:yes stop_codon:yes gene_type:complete